MVECGRESPKRRMTLGAGCEWRDLLLYPLDLHTSMYGTSSSMPPNYLVWITMLPAPRGCWTPLS
jgi:hypothetical protein